MLLGYPPVVVWRAFLLIPCAETEPVAGYSNIAEDVHSTPVPLPAFFFILSHMCRNFVD